MAESDSNQDRDETPDPTSEPTQDATPDSGAPTAPGRPVTTATLVRDVLLYTLARLALVALIAGILLAVKVPLLVAFAVGVIVALPLSLLVLKKLRTRVSTEIATVNTQRQAERDKLRAELRGE